MGSRAMSLDAFRRREVRITLALLTAMILIVALVAALPGAKAVVSTNPASTYGTDGRVLAIVEANGKVYIGGSFTNAVAPGGNIVPRRNLMAINVATGALDPDFKPEPSGTINGLAVSADGTRIFVGGGFGTIGGLKRKNLAAVDATTGKAISGWKADAIGGKVESVVAGNGRVYAGGAFTSINDSAGSTARFNLAAVSATDGRIDSGWNARVAGEDPVRTLALSPDNNRLFFGGDFLEVAGVARRHLAAVNAQTSALDTTFNAKELPVVFGVTADSARVYVALGGAGGEVQGLDAGTGAKKWFVHGNGNFQSVAVMGDLLYVAGHYGGSNAFGGQERYKLSAVVAATGQVTSFAPRIDSPLGVFEVRASAPRVYIGGDFTTVQGEKQPHFAVLSE